MKNSKRIQIKQFLLSIIVIGTISIGWKFTLLGFIVPMVMMSAVLISLFKGRYHCGNFCPRAMFLNFYLPGFSRNKPIPSFLKTTYFRLGIVLLMVFMMTFMISDNPGNIYHWGFVFWKMCAVTTGIGIVLGLIYRPRTWCSFCPMGSMQNAVGGHKSNLRIEYDKCKACKICEKKCPLDLTIITDKNQHEINNRDCIHCSQCVAVCPVNALDFYKKSCA